MSIAAIRDAFNRITEPKGIRCLEARLHFCDAQGGTAGPRNRCKLELDVIDAASNKKWTIATGVIPEGASAYDAARSLAVRTVETQGPPDAA